MSIFKDTFIPEVQGQLKARQNSLKKRDVTSIKYLNSRNAWIKMSSSVNVNGTSDLADNYQLKGGILSPQGLRAGVFNPNNLNATYDTNTPLGEPHLRGLRPMPGINSIDIRSKSAYGSLREVVVKFQCWDIKQLEDLELLYMRPGYTVLVEWGWTPYLQSNDNGDQLGIIYNTQTFDIIRQTPSKEDIWKELFNKSKSTGGNYDAMFGYVKNYSWSAREDGGYDCSTTIISIGEILESLKVNYSPFTTKLTKGTKGLLNKIFLDDDLVRKYKKNILAGLFAELYAIVIKDEPSPEEDGKTSQLPDLKNDGKKYNFYLRKLQKTNLTLDADKIVNSNINEIDIYITLDSLFEILNKYVILKDEKNKNPMVKLSSYEREYDKKDSKIPKPLLCSGNPLQISVDPTVCLIGNDFWCKLKNQTKITSPENPLTTGFNTFNPNLTITGFNNKSTKYLKNLIPYFYKEDPKTELGIIGNIYINLQFLYSLSLDNNLESQDKKEKQEISVYDFLKNVMSQVSNCIGNVNNFDIHIDPTDNIARIIDVNYVDEENKAVVFKNAFELQIQNLSSTVRSYKLESQIFQEQSTIIAIGAQVQGGALGTDGNTMNGFNRGITDRIIPIKEEPLVDNKATIEETRKEQLKNLKNNLSIIYDFFGDTTSYYLFWSQAAYDANRAGEYKGALRDLINGFKSFTDTKSKYNAIIPTKLSITMDGIGGLVIGHIFKIPDDLLPKGYKGGELGSKLGHIITSIGHSISNNDWVTNIDAQTIILDDPIPGIDGEILSYEDLIKLIEQGQPFDLQPSQLNVLLENQNFTNSNISNINYKFNLPEGNKLPSGINPLVSAAKKSIGFSIANIEETNNGNVGCAAAVSVIFTRATGRKIISPNSIIYNTPPSTSTELEYSTRTLFENFSKNPQNWRKRKDWRMAQPGDIIITPTLNSPGHTGVVIDDTITKNNKTYYKIVSNSSSGLRGIISSKGTIQSNYDIYSWEFSNYSVYPRNPSQTTAFEYIGPVKV
jgi:hypothetical protein